MINALFFSSSFFEKFPRHKALKCHLKCRQELNKGGGEINFYSIRGSLRDSYQLPSILLIFEVSYKTNVSLRAVQWQDFAFDERSRRTVQLSFASLNSASRSFISCEIPGHRTALRETFVYSRTATAWWTYVHLPSPATSLRPNWSQAGFWTCSKT